MLPLKPNEQIDWFRVFTDVEHQGLSIRQLSMHVGIPRSTLQRWKSGNGQPRFDDSLRLLLFWADCCDRSISDVPRRLVNPPCKIL